LVNIEMQEAGIIPFGVEFKNPNFVKVADAMGAKGIRIEEPCEVREGLAEALAYKEGRSSSTRSSILSLCPYRRMFLFKRPKAPLLALPNKYGAARWTR
jgi:hypothetical protein